MKHYNYFVVDGPYDDFFCRNEALRDLWYNRNDDEPITSRELFSIVDGIAKAIQRVEECATRAERNGNIYNYDL